MSLAPGNMLKKSSMPEAKAKTAMRQLVLALQHIHNQGIAHLDIKPENLIWDPEKQHLTLIDFGEARFMNQDGEIPQHLSAGTAAYRDRFSHTKNGQVIDAYAVGKTCEKILRGAISPEAQAFIDKCLEGQLDPEDPWLLQ